VPFCVISYISCKGKQKSGKDKKKKRFLAKKILHTIYSNPWNHLFQRVEQFIPTGGTACSNEWNKSLRGVKQ
jgi:hypothetical protein